MARAYGGREDGSALCVGEIRIEALAQQQLEELRATVMRKGVQHGAAVGLAFRHVITAIHQRTPGIMHADEAWALWCVHGPQVQRQWVGMRAAERLLGSLHLGAHVRALKVFTKD